MFPRARPVVPPVAFRMPSARVSSFASRPYMVHVNAGKFSNGIEGTMYPLMVNDPVDIPKPKRSVRFAPFTHSLLFAMSEIDDPQILKLQRLGDLAKCGLRSHDLGLSAVESANWNPLKKVWAEKHSKKEHGTTRDETDDILDIIYGTNDVMDTKLQLDNLHKYGRSVALSKSNPMSFNVKASIRYRTYGMSVEKLLKVGKFAYAMLKLRSGDWSNQLVKPLSWYQFSLTHCVREVLERCSLSYKKFVRKAGGEVDAAKDIVAMTGILALTCENFRTDFSTANSNKKNILTKGPWKHTWGTWIHRNWNGLYCQHIGSTINPDSQLHVTEAPEIILKIAEFLGRHGGIAVATLDKAALVSMAINICTVFDVIKDTKCDWMVTELAVRLHELAKLIACAGLGCECIDIEGNVLAALKVLAEATLQV